MTRSFGVVDEKLAEADFFLDKMSEAQYKANMFEMRCYFSAFVTASRSVTFCLKASLKGTDGFDEWYEQMETILKGDKTARFFKNTRNEIQKIGITPLNAGKMVHSSHGRPIVKFYFSGSPDEVPTDDVVSISKQYLKLIVGIIRECYNEFGNIIDPAKYYTLANLKRLNLTIEDVEDECGYPRGWTQVDGISEESRLELLKRDIPMSNIDHLFKKYC